MSLCLTFLTCKVGISNSYTVLDTVKPPHKYVPLYNDVIMHVGESGVGGGGNSCPHPVQVTLWLDIEARWPPSPFP